MTTCRRDDVLPAHTVFARNIGRVRVRFGDLTIAGWCLALIGRFVAAAILTHIVSDLPAGYTWFGPVAIILDSLRGPHFPVMALCVLVCAGYHREIWRGVAQARLQGTKTKRRAALGATAGAVFGVFVGIMTPHYTLIDQLAAIAVLTAMFAVPPSISGPSRTAWHTTAVFVLLILVSYGFTIFKALLFTDASPHDAFLMAMEERLFGAQIHRVFADLGKDYPSLLVLADQVYFRFFQHMALAAIFLFARANPAEQAEYAIAMAMAYMIGAFSYYVVPAYGPAFADASAYEHLRQHPLITNAVQADLWANTRAAASGTLALIPSYAFPASMPSLHVTHELVMLYYARSSRALFCLSLGFTLMSAVSTMMLGWHYFIDLIPSLALAAVVIAGARRSISAAPFSRLHLPSSSRS